MKIVLLNDEFYTTGASIAMLRLAEHLHQHHEVRVMPRIDGDGPIRTRLQQLGIPISSKASGADVIIANTIMAGAFVAEHGTKCPVIWWIHEGDIGRRFLLREPSLAQGFSAAAAIVYQTTYQQMVYGSFTHDSAASLHVMPFWNNAVYQEQAIEPAPKSKLRIVAIGTIEPRKRFEDIVNAVELLDPSLQQQLECVFIGKHIRMEAREKAIIECSPGRYRLLGEQTNDAALRYLASADCFVLPSFSESQPLTIWEALELEVPICLSDLETYRHIGIRHGVHGLLHPVGNVEMLAENLRIALTNRKVKAALIKDGKSLLLNMLASDWHDQFDRIISKVVTQSQIRTLGY